MRRRNKLAATVLCIVLALLAVVLSGCSGKVEIDPAEWHCLEVGRTIHYHIQGAPIERVECVHWKKL